MTRAFDISNDIDEQAQEDYTAGELLDEERDMPAVSPQTPPAQDSYIKWGIVASCLLHAAFFVWLLLGPDLSPHRYALKPGEEVTPVRLVEMPDTTPAEEKPPPRASAMSDRNHTAKIEKRPMRPPGKPRMLGSIAPPQDRIAALSPPRAPEFPKEAEPREKEKEPKRKPIEKPLSPALERHWKPDPEERFRSEERPRREELLNRQLDLRPTPGEIARALAGPSGAGEFFRDGDVDEAVVDLNTREDRYFSYMLHLKRKIEGVWSYPAAAARTGMGGELTVEFLIASDGKLLAARLLDSSGFDLLDQTALTAIRAAAPYHPFPPRMKMKRLRIRARFIYLTQSFFRRVM